MEAKSVKLNPRGDRLLVKVVKPKEETSKGGILLPDISEKNRPVFGEVLAVGDGRVATARGMVTVEMPEVGVIVMFGRHAGQTYRINDELIMCLREGELAFDVEEFPYADEAAEHAVQTEAASSVRPR